MKCLYLLFFLLVVNSKCGLAQKKAVELVWYLDTSSFAIGRSLPVDYRGAIKQIQNNILNSAKPALFSYPIEFGNEKIYLNCCLTVNDDSVLLAIDKNFDSVFQDAEIFQYTAEQYKDENFVINFSVSKKKNEEVFFLLGSLKTTSLKINTADSILNLNPLYLQSKNYMRSSFKQGGEMYHAIVMNTFPAIGIEKNFKYLVTKTRIDDSDFLKITNWSKSNDTVLINEKQAIVSTRKNNGVIGFSVIEANNLFGTFLGAKMPRITVSDMENSILQLPITRTGKLHLIEFWGTWCGPCIALYPGLSSLLRANTNFLTYTGIAGDDDKEKVLRYIEKKADIKRQVFEPDNNKSIVSLFKIQSYPTFILVDDGGIIVAKESGSTGFNLVVEKINEIKARQTNPSISK